MRKYLWLILIILAPLALYAASGVNGVNEPAVVAGVATPDKVNSVSGLAAAGGLPVATLTDVVGYISYVAGTAFIWTPNNDISAYAGTTGSSTPYYVLVKDDEGDSIKGYLGSQGAGETLDGTNMFDDGDFASGGLTNWPDSGADWSAEEVGDWRAVHGGNSEHYLSQDNEMNSGSGMGAHQYKLFKVTFEVETCTSVGFKWYLSQEYLGDYGECSVGTKTEYQIQKEDWSHDWGIIASSITAGLSVDDFSCKQVTDPPATYGLHIVFADDGSTRNWTEMTGTFDFGYAERQTYVIEFYSTD